ncbi:MAG: hypothetical protein M3552_11725 [Planctomycetota bacterium]|nr:hypothetical protein [Planctomycetaceae bacterium]MDQ3331303.1 hypothetical protein [Planctomycetota bacterium]
MSRPFRTRLPLLAIIAVNVVTLAAFAVAAASLTGRGERRVVEALSATTTAPRLPISHERPVMVEPYYDDPSVVSDEELRDVLEKVRPRFGMERLQPNYVEHALRAWGPSIEFHEPGVMDGPEMVLFLTDYGRHLASWGVRARPLLVERPQGIAINWGKRPGESVHHDHWLACLTEAGLPLETPIFGPNRRGDTLNDALQEALRDFDPNERETEWSVMAFGFWLPPDHQSWTNRDGRRIDFDLLAETLMRGASRFGVCGGTHRVYSLMVLLRLDDDHRLLSPPMREGVYEHLRRVRDAISLSQHASGEWGTDWPNGAAAYANPLREPAYRQVIATGHHLEWLAIAYPDLQPNREVVQRAADWLVQTVRDIPQEDLIGQYTFFSHVGNALSLWRKTHPAEAWPKLSAGQSLAP